MKNFRLFVFYFLAVSFFFSGGELFSVPANNVIEEIEINESGEENGESEESLDRSSSFTKKLSGAPYSRKIKSVDADFHFIDYFTSPVSLSIIDHLAVKVCDQSLQKNKLFILYSRLKLDC